MGRRWRPQIERVGTIGHDSKDDEVPQPPQVDQGEVGGQHVPLLGHGEEIETPN